MRAFGDTSAFEVKVSNETPGPQRMIAWKPVGGIESACGILEDTRPSYIVLEIFSEDDELYLSGFRSLFKILVLKFMTIYPLEIVY